MDNFTPHMIELAKQYGGFLSTLGATLLATLGVVVGLSNRTDKKIQHGLACILCLAFVCFSGVQMMAEVSGLPSELDTPIRVEPAKAVTQLLESPRLRNLKASKELLSSSQFQSLPAVVDLPASKEFASIHRDFEIATTDVYLVSIGFLLSLVYLAAYFDERSKAGNGLWLFASAMQFFTVLGTVIFICKFAETICKRPGFVEQSYASHWEMYAFPACAAGVILLLNNRIKADSVAVPRPVWCLFIFGSLSSLYFFLTYLKVQRLTEAQLSTQMFAIWTTGLLSIWQTPGDPLYTWAKQFYSKKSPSKPGAHTQRVGGNHADEPQQQNPARKPTADADLTPGGHALDETQPPTPAIPTTQIIEAQGRSKPTHNKPSHKKP